MDAVAAALPGNVKLHTWQLHMFSPLPYPDNYRGCTPSPLLYKNALHPQHTDLLASPLSSECLAPLDTDFVQQPQPPTLDALPSLGTLTDAVSAHAFATTSPALHAVLRAQVQQPAEEYVWEAGGGGTTGAGVAVWPAGGGSGGASDI